MGQRQPSKRGIGRPGQCGGMSPEREHARTTVCAPMTPLGRTKIVAVLSLGTAAVLAPAAYVGFEATIGRVWSHNHALDACAATPTPKSISNRAVGISVRESWNWWLPGHSHVCVYDMPRGRAILRPVPSYK